MDDPPVYLAGGAEEFVIDLGDAADLTLGDGSDDNEDKRKIYN